MPDEPRKCAIIPGFVGTADGSCLIETGKTRVICTATVEEGVPPFLIGKGKGWVTAEYAMLPASTGRRKARDGIKKDGRGVEIQRLIGRSLRQAVDFAALGERTITLDCDVLEADGGTRTASITGAFVALTLAVDKLIKAGKLAKSPIIRQVAAISAGVVGDTPCLDLCYVEDSSAQVDMNLVMNDWGEFIEVQGTGEGRAFSRKEMDELFVLGEAGIRSLMAVQREALGDTVSLIPLIPSKPLLVAATGNAHKLRELEALFGPWFEVKSMKDAGFTSEIEETGKTFRENAVLKAEAVCRATGHWALADDSGLSVDALNGAPGVYSARYAGEHGNDGANNALLLKTMENITNRGAKFVSAIALAGPGEETLVVEGECPGTIIYEPRGTDGFGYDPLFLYETGLTFAQMPAEEKNKVSHRARAAEKMLEVVKKKFSVAVE
jgi:XTP/dITP diphosphohydrolase